MQGLVDVRFVVSAMIPAVVIMIEPYARKAKRLACELSRLRAADAHCILSLEHKRALRVYGLRKVCVG